MDQLERKEKERGSGRGRMEEATSSSLFKIEETGEEDLRLVTSGGWRVMVCRDYKQRQAAHKENR